MADSVHETSGSKREQTKLRNRSILIGAARAVFVELGYDAASVRDIVARTRLAPGTFYNYFPDKRSILIALMNEASVEATRRVREARAGADSLQALVYRGFRAYFDFIVYDRTTFELMRRNVATLRSLGIDETGFAAGLEVLRDDLSAAVARGTLPDIPLRYVPAAIGAIAFEVGAQMVATDPPDVEGATRFAAELCIGGIERLGRSARHPATGGRAAQTERSKR